MFDDDAFGCLCLRNSSVFISGLVFSFLLTLLVVMFACWYFVMSVVGFVLVLLVGLLWVD